MVHKSPFDNIDIPHCNILSYLFPQGKKPSDTPIWIDANCPSNYLSPSDMLTWVKRFAVGLDNLGVQKNEAIMVFTPNHIFVPVVYLGAAGSQRYYTGANPAYTADELAHQMSVVKAAVLLIHPTLFKVGFTAYKKAKLPGTRIFQFSDQECLEQYGVQDWKTILASKADADSWEWDHLGEDATHQMATINFSSGTTGLPKGVCTSHYNLIANTTQTIFVKFQGQPPSETGSSERWLAFLPLYHAFSQLFTINIACRLEVPVYIMQKFALQDFLRHIQQYKITSLQAVPPVMSMLVKHREITKYDLRSLKNIMVGAAPLSVRSQNEIMERFRVFVSRGWGMTETTCVGTLLPDNVTNTDGSVGYLLPNTEAMIVDENGSEIQNGPGELLVRGPQMMLGYWNDKKATEAMCSTDGWVRTGDTVIAKNGLWWIVDRKKELIKVNGLQVAPAELEAVLLQHECISDATVVGLTLDGDEYPRAYVVRTPIESSNTLGEEDVQRYVAEKVAKHKRLTGGVKFVKTIPRLLSGKIMRSVVRDWAKEDEKTFGRSGSRL